MDAWIEVVKQLAILSWLCIAVGVGLTILIGGILFLVWAIADLLGLTN